MTSILSSPLTARWQAEIAPEARRPSRFARRSARRARRSTPADLRLVAGPVDAADPKISFNQGAAMETRKLAFLGLGVMGFPMAGHLARAGHSVTVYNRTASRAELWLASTAPAQKSSSASTPAAAAA